RGLSAARADEVFADPDYTRQFLAHLETSTAAKLSHQWLRGRLTRLMRPDLAVVDMGCGLNPFADLPCHVTGLDRHDRPGQLRGKMENPPLPDKSADVLIYSLSLYGPAADLKNYFAHAGRILRGGGHLFIVEPNSVFTSEGLARFVDGLRQFGFELVGTVKELRGEDGTLLKALHLTLTGDMGDPPTSLFERK
ncbi:MAG: methyltransferase domain-containing protein, partial [Chloroflexota bacterium]